MNDRLELKSSIRVADDGQIIGIAWPWGSVDRIGDRIQKGAFGGISSTVPMLWAHLQDEPPIGRWDSIVESAEGLEVRGTLFVDDIRRAREVYILAKNGVLSGLSIGFITKKATPIKGGGRIISALELIEVSIVTTPMNPAARITATKSANSALSIAAAVSKAAMAIRGA